MNKLLNWVLVYFLSFWTMGILAHPYTPCEDGMADFYACNNTDLSHRIHLENLGDGTGNGNDIWGWTDPLDGKEYALMGLTNGTAFVDISNPRTPVNLGYLPTATSTSTWRDIKTFDNHAFIVSEAPGHGMQVFDLTQLRGVTNPPLIFTATANYTEFGDAHNIVINEDSGYAYVVGANCAGGLHMIDISIPATPVNMGCFDADGYTHDAQCVMYVGPDKEHVGKEICFNSNVDTLTIVDVSTKANPIQLSRTPYDDSRYTHQGWLTEDQRYYLMNDELDEQNFGHNTKTYIWDLLDLESPTIVGTYIGPQASIDHNLYIKGNFAYLSNYTSGLSVVDISGIGSGNLVEVANFDSFPNSNSASIAGAWSNYPYFESGQVILSDMQGGLFILEPLLCPVVAPATDLQTVASGDNSISLNWNDSLATGESYSIYRSEGGCAVDNFIKVADNVFTESFVDSMVTGQLNVGYRVSKLNAEGVCESERSACSETITTGECTAAPFFEGVSNVNVLNSNTCGLTIEWAAASSACQSSSTYNVYRSTSHAFTPGPDNLIASGLTGSSYQDLGVVYGDRYHYVVRAVDVSNGQEDHNSVMLSGTPQGELGNGNWSGGAEVGETGIGSTSRHLGWDIVSNEFYTGEKSYWSQNSSNLCNRITSNVFTLTTGEVSELSFYNKYNIESRWDGGLLEISVDGGAWIQPAISPDYPNTFRDSNDECGFPENTPAFSGIQKKWEQHTVDLSAYAGQNVAFRFSYSTDGVVNGGGWYVDEMALTNVQVPGMCGVSDDLIFASGFELDGN